MVDALYDNDTARLNFGRTMKEMTKKLIIALKDFLPAFVTAASDAGDETHVGLVSARFGGRPFDVDRTWRSMAVMDADEDENARQQFQEYLVLVVDGSGTVIYEPNQTLTRLQHFCYWKEEYQIRWYVVVDMHGHIVFLSSTYVGKLDDSSALKHTGFYE